MKICLMSTRFPPYHVGGEEIYVKRLYDSLRDKGKNIVYNINNTINKKFKDKNIINLSLKNNLFLGSFNLPNPNLFFKLKQILQKMSPDIIHINNTHSTLSTEIFFMPAKYPKVLEIHDYGLFCLDGDNLYHGKPCNRYNECWKCVHQTYSNSLTLRKKLLIYKILIFIWSATNFKLRNKLIAALKRFMTVKALAGVNKIICPSKNILLVCRKFGINEKKLAYLPYGIDLSKFKSAKIPRKKSVGFVGRLERLKGCHLLIEAFQKVAQEIPDACLYVVGDGKEENNLKAQVRNLDLRKNVFFLGRKKEEELKSFYHEMQFLVLPSVWLETPSLIAYEAMASARPVIASNIGDFPELIKDGENSFLFKPNNPEDLANKIIYLLKNPKEVNRLAKNALKTIKKYSTEEHNKKLIKVYKEAISHNFSKKQRGIENEK